MESKRGRGGGWFKMLYSAETKQSRTGITFMAIKKLKKKKYLNSKQLMEE